MHVCKIFKLSENKKKKQNRKKFGIMLTFGKYSADNSQVGFDWKQNTNIKNINIGNSESKIMVSYFSNKLSTITKEA